MKFKMEIEMDNSAFEDDQAGGGPELARILNKVGLFASQNMIAHDYMHDIRDANGNTVGHYAIIVDNEE